MSRRKERIDDEQRSYSTVFLFAIGLLLIGTGWTLWDDNISRRPWKKYQVEFSGQWIDQARQHRKLAGLILHRDGSVSETAGQLEGTAIYGQSGYPCYHLLF